MRLRKNYDRANTKIQRPLTSGGRKTKRQKMSFEINIPSKHAAIELSPTFKGDLHLVFDNDFLAILAKQVIDEINTADLHRWLAKARDIQWDYKNLVKRKGV
jgi:hypothetical protein